MLFCFVLFLRHWNTLYHFVETFVKPHYANQLKAAALVESYKREPNSSAHRTSSEDHELKQNPGVLEKMRTSDLANPQKAFFHSIPEGTSCKIYLSLLTRSLLKAAHFTWQIKFTHLLWPIGTDLSPSTRKMKTNKNQVCFHSFMTVLKSEFSLSILFLWSDFQTFHLPGMFSSVTNQNMGFKKLNFLLSRVSRLAVHIFYEKL